MAKLTKSEILDQLERRYPETCTIVWLVKRMKNPARKLFGLLTVLVLGHQVTVAPDGHMAIDGGLRTWIELEMDEASLLSTLKIVQPQPVVAALDHTDLDEIDVDALETQKFDDHSAYEESISRRLGVSVEQLRKEQAEADKEADRDRG